MVLTNCQICGKAFNCMGGRPICTECRLLEEKEYLKVREFVKDNPKVSLEIVSKETGVPTEKIRRYLNDGLLEKASLKDNEYNCQLCGKSISSGNYCLSCLTKLKEGRTAKPKETGKKKDKVKAGSFMLEYRKKK